MGRGQSPGGTEREYRILLDPSTAAAVRVAAKLAGLTPEGYVELCVNERVREQTDLALDEAEDWGPMGPARGRSPN